MLIAGVLAVLAIVAAACGSNEPASNTSPGASGTGATGSPSPTFSTLKEGVLQVGSCLDYPPFETVKNGVEQGFDIDITEEIASRLGLQVEWIKADFDTIFTAVAGGQFDMVAAASTITPEREQTVDFSDGYFNALLALTVNTQSTPDITSTDQLGSGDTVGVQKGTTGKDWAEQNLQPQGVAIKAFTSATDAFRDLEGGDITGVINDDSSSAAIVKDLPSLKLVQSIDAKQLYGLAFSPDNPGLRDAVNAALADMIADGAYLTIFHKWIPGVEPPPEFQPAG
jgi:polar amino acid transport system substrate-binding protein